MLRKIASLAGLLLLTVFAYAQNGKIKGSITDDAGEPLPFATVTVEKDGIPLTGAQSDFDGNFTISPVKPGTYDLVCSFVGYQSQKVTGMIVKPNNITFAKPFVMSEGVALDEVKVVAYSNPLIDPDFKSGGTKTREDIAVSPLRQVSAIATTTAGVFSEDDGSGAMSVRGSRNGSTDVYIDGIKVRGSSNLPTSGIEQVTVITGGVPAQYGDATGGIISVTTRGPAPKAFGGIEILSSQLTDAFNYNLLGFNVSGPLVSKEDTVLGLTRPVLGYFIAGELNHQKDPTPSAIGMYKVKDDVLANLELNPLRPSPTGMGTLRNAEFLRLDPNEDGDISDGDFEKISAKQNVEQTSVRLSAKFDYSPTDKFNFTLGGSANYDRGHSFINAYSLFNPVNNPEYISQTYRVYGRVTHRFGNENNTEESSSNVKNAYYSIQVDYSKVLGETQDDSHQDNIFNYGYYGAFTTDLDETYSYNADLDAMEMTGFLSREYTFEESDLNPNAANFTSQYYSIYEDNPSGNYQNWAQVQQGGALLNGDRPSNIYSLWYNTGRQYGGYSKSDASQFRVVGSASADIKNHGVKFGFEYEQRDDRSFSTSPIGIWTLMRQLANEKNTQLDTDNPVYVTDVNGVFQDTIRYNRLYEQGDAPGFFENIRQELGISNTEFVDIDSYDPTTTNFNLGMFTPDELLNNSNGYVTTYGYDFEGNKLGGSASFNDFFTKKDENGNFTREIAPFTPIYMAGYVQDKFSFKDIVFNIGVRIDRYDANQMVLKDNYLWYETYQVKDYTAGGNTFNNIDATVPSNISEDAYIYVDDIEDPSAILGYRVGDTWFNAEGTELQEPSSIANSTSTGEIQPWLVDSDDDIKSDDFDASKSFTDYVPQVNVSPRISFSFPISDEAMFFAHYDILAQRPSMGASFLTPTDYLFVENNVGGLLNNPNLKPEKTTDYELGFTQTLSSSSAITLSAFYRELRDMIQVINVNYAYPAQYITFGNIDFGTVKGFTFKYDMRRTKNVSVNASYTLQFADGTGSGATSGISLVSSGQPNLRTLIPLDYDQRHRVQATIDYRFGAKDQYNGPKWGKKILQDAGVNLIVNAGSGLPYSQQSNVTQAVAMGVSERSVLMGSINGARLPWQFRIDGRINKNIAVAFGKEKSKKANMNVYCQVMNMLDARNVTGVYRATGNPDDTGFLTASQSQSLINSQVNPASFIDLYSMKSASPFNYALPRRIRLGLTLDF